jgi:hypothetical protein
MSDKKETVNMFDPTGMLKGLRDAGMENWAKMMTEVVNSDTYSSAQGEMLDGWLATSAPFQKAMENAMKQSLASLQLPSRDDVTRLAERFTNIEMRLDDIEAKLDESLKRQG